MSIITSIKPQNNGKRVNIYLDGEFGFGLDLETFVKHKLKVEQQLTEEEIEKVVKEGEFQKVYEKILHYASIRPRSEKEFSYWLKKHKVHESMYDELFNRLKRLELLDDKKFATWWVKQRLQFKSKSVRALKLELSQKGIKKELIAEALDEARIDEAMMAKRLIERKKYMWAKLDGYISRKKKSEFLARRGFSWDVIKKVLDNDVDYE